MTNFDLGDLITLKSFVGANFYDVATQSFDLIGCEYGDICMIVRLHNLDTPQYITECNSAIVVTMNGQSMFVRLDEYIVIS